MYLDIWCINISCLNFSTRKYCYVKIKFSNRSIMIVDIKKCNIKRLFKKLKRNSIYLTSNLLWNIVLFCNIQASSFIDFCYLLCHSPSNQNAREKVEEMCRNKVTQYLCGNCISIAETSRSVNVPLKLLFVIYFDILFLFFFLLIKIILKKRIKLFIRYLFLISCFWSIVKR